MGATMILGKVWGTTECMIDTPMLSMHRLVILPNMTCSMHKHDFRWNGFLVTKGRLIIEVKKNAYPLTDKTVLGPGDVTSVRPGEFHRFVTESEGCEGFEFYYPEGVSDADIVRETCGGPVSVAASQH
jgi:mannose-6-phosphate isomerase-like protein (cupin superfamily)